MNQLGTRSAALAIAVFAGGLVVEPSGAQFTHDGPDVLVSGQETLDESLYYAQGNVAADATGQFVVTWSAFSSDAFEDTFARRFDSDGSPLGPGFRINVATARSQASPSVAMAGDGRFVVVWNDVEPFDASETENAMEVGARVFDAAGNAVSGDIVVNAFTSGRQSDPAVGLAADGRFVVLWGSAPYAGPEPGQDGSASGVFGRLYDASGAPLGPEFAVNTYTTGSQSEPSVAMRPDGSFVAVWDGAGPDGSADIFARAFDVAGVPVGPEFAVNANGPRGGASRVAVDTDGSFIVAWQSGHVSNWDGSSAAALARRFDASGAPLTPPFLLNAFTTGPQYAPAIAPHGDGTFSAVWLDGEQFHPSGDRSVVRRFASDGSPLGAETPADYGTPSRPSLIARSDGSVVVVSLGRKRPQGNTPYLVAMQRLCDPASGCTPDDGCGAGEDAFARIKLANVGVDANPSDDTLSLKGEFDLPHGTILPDFVDEFSSVDAEGFRVVVAANDGSIRSDDSLNGFTQSLRTRAGDTSLVIRPYSATINGIRSVSLKQRRGLSDLAPDRIQVKLKAKAGSFPVVPGDEPLRVTLELGGRPTCGPETFAPSECVFNPAQTALSCK